MFSEQVKKEGRDNRAGERLKQPPWQDEINFIMKKNNFQMHEKTMPWKMVITGNLLDSKKGAPDAELCLAETGTCQDIKKTDDK